MIEETIWCFPNQKERRRNDKWYSTEKVTVNLSHINIDESTFYCSNNMVELFPRNGTVVFPYGTLLDVDHDKDGVPDAAIYTVKYCLKPSWTVFTSPDATAKISSVPFRLTGKEKSDIRSSICTHLDNRDELLYNIDTLHKYVVCIIENRDEVFKRSVSDDGLAFKEPYPDFKIIKTISVKPGFLLYQDYKDLVVFKEYFGGYEQIDKLGVSEDLMPTKENPIVEVVSVDRIQDRPSGQREHVLFFAKRGES